MLKEIYDKGKVLLLGEDNEEPYERLAQDMVARDAEIKMVEEHHDRYMQECAEANDMVPYKPLRWGGVESDVGILGSPPITTYCTTAMEDVGEIIPPDTFESRFMGEWRCEGCNSVMLSEHRQCEECGAPRHFLYGVDDDRQ